jgi:hypothetical protein
MSRLDDALARFEALINPDTMQLNTDNYMTISVSLSRLREAMCRQREDRVKALEVAAERLGPLVNADAVIADAIAFARYLDPFNGE